MSQHFLPHPSVKQSAIVALLVGLKVSLGSHVPKQRLVEVEASQSSREDPSGCLHILSIASMPASVACDKKRNVLDFFFWENGKSHGTACLRVDGFPALLGCRRHLTLLLTSGETQLTSSVALSACKTWILLILLGPVLLGEKEGSAVCRTQDDSNLICS